MEYLQILIQTIILLPWIIFLILRVYVDLKKALIYSFPLYLVSLFLIMLYLFGMIISILIIISIFLIIGFTSYKALVKKYKRGAYKYISKNIRMKFVFISIPLQIILLVISIYI